MSKERLEEHTHVAISISEYKKLKERVQELEENLERRDGVYRENVYRMEKEHQLFGRIYDLEQQNKCYIEKIQEAKEMASCCGMTAVSILDEALEEYSK